ncbi:MAG: tetratricopeptide repeat protein [Arsukibacterium sp.]|nr:tetratricopeptide repeat protein [Arsukibacterium sp.]
MVSFRQFYQQVHRRKVISTVLAYLVIVWLALQVVAVVSQLLQLSPLPGHIIAISLVAAVPVICYLAWYYQLQQGRLKLIASADGQPPATFGAKQQSGLLLLAVCCALLGYQYYLLSRPVATAEPVSLAANSVAVLPFTSLNQTDNSNVALLANSLAEEISSQLARSPGLTVAAASSGQVLSRQQLSPTNIASRLNVATLLSGSIGLTGQQLHIRLQLLDGQSGQTLWSQQLTRELKNIFTLETEVARSVANALQANLTNALSLKDLSANASTQSADAYVSYLQAREQYRLQTSEAMQQARSLFEQAIAQDPEYALAYIGLADTLLLLSDGSKEFGIIDVDIATKLAAEYLEKALRRAPQLAEAYAIQGKMLELKQQYAPALAAYQQAIALNPNLAIAHMWQYLLLKQQGKYDESLLALERAYQLDPVSIAVLYNRGYEQAIRGQFEQATASFNQLLQDFPKSPLGHVGMSLVAFNQGLLADSLFHWQQAWQLSPDNLSYKQNYQSLLLTLNLASDHPELKNDPNNLLRQGDYQALFKKMEFLMAAQPNDSWLIFWTAWYQMLVGEQHIAIDLLLQSYPAFSEEELFAMPMCSPAIEVAWALKQQKQEQKAKVLLSRCQQQLSDALQSELRDSYINHLAARLAALQGNNKLAIRELQQALAYGWREWWTFKDPVFATLPDEQLAPLRQQLENALNEQRQLVLSRAKQLAPANQQQP